MVLWLLSHSWNIGECGSAGSCQHHARFNVYHERWHPPSIHCRDQQFGPGILQCVCLVMGSLTVPYNLSTVLGLFYGRKTLKVLQASGRVTGVALFKYDGETLHGSFSADKTCPNDGYGKPFLIFSTAERICPFWRCDLLAKSSSLHDLQWLLVQSIDWLIDCSLIQWLLVQSIDWLIDCHVPFLHLFLGFYDNLPGESSCGGIPWNSAGNGMLFQRWNFPIFLLYQDEDIDYLLNDV